MSTISFAKPLLERWGLTVQDIPTTDTEQADFLASAEGYVVLIEEKSKIDDAARLAIRQQVLDSGKIYISSRPIVRTNRLSGVVRKAASQLEASSTRKHDFRLIWFTATGYEAEALSHQFVATLYGTTNVLEMGSTHYRRCYFFRNSDFHRYAETVDGAVAAHLRGEALSAKLCLNPLSVRVAKLRASSFAKLFGTDVEDPEALESNGEAFIVSSDVDRSKESAVLTDLQQKYKTRPLMTFDLGYHSAAMAVRYDDR